MLDFFSNLLVEHSDEIVDGLKYICKRICYNFIADSFYKKAKNHSNANKSGLNQ